MIHLLLQDNTLFLHGSTKQVKIFSGKIATYPKNQMRQTSYMLKTQSLQLPERSMSVHLVTAPS
jgi:hypothetical protein